MYNEITQIQLLNFCRKFTGFEFWENGKTLQIFTTMGQLYITPNENKIAFRVLNEEGIPILWFEQTPNTIEFESSFVQEYQQQIEQCLEFAKRVSLYNELNHFCVSENNGENLYNIWIKENYLEIQSLRHNAIVKFQNGLTVNITTL